MKLVPVRRSKKLMGPIYVTAPDAATHDKLLARYDALFGVMDDKLMTITSDFIREHCGIEVTRRPPT